jgi:hypothetical protein
MYRRKEQLFGVSCDVIELLKNLQMIGKQERHGGRTDCSFFRTIRLGQQDLMDARFMLRVSQTNLHIVGVCI